MLFPMIGFGEREGKVKVNFGTQPFIYDINAHDWTVEQMAATLQASMSSKYHLTKKLYMQ